MTSARAIVRGAYSLGQSEDVLDLWDEGLESEPELVDRRLAGLQAHARVVDELDELGDRRDVDPLHLPLQEPDRADSLRVVEQDGTRVYYRITDDGVFALCEQLCGSLQNELSTLSALVGGTS